MKRIKKVSQTVPTYGQIVDGYSDSTTDGYSANYVNNKIIDNYSTTEVKTNKTWIDGKPIYRKVITYNYAEGSTTASIPSGISNLDKVVLLNPIMLRSASDFEINYYSSSSDYLRTFYRYSTNAIEVRSSAASPNTVFYITIEYTKTTN